MQNEKFISRIIGAILIATGLAVACSHHPSKSELSQQSVHTQELESLARQAYTFGYPLVLMNANQKAMSASPAWMDLREEPVVISVPEMGKRFYAGSLVDGWADVTTVIGTRTTGNHKANFVIVGPSWSGDLPENMQVIHSPTSLAWFSLQLEGSQKADLRTIKKFKIISLDKWTGNKKSTASRTTASAESTDQDASARQGFSPADEVFAMDAATFYTQLCRLMLDNPPTVADAEALHRFEALGIQPMASFDFSRLTPEVQQALIKSTDNAKNQIFAREGNLQPTEAINGWQTHNNLTDFGTDYDRRAYVALTALGSPRAQDVLSFRATTDNLGQRLSSSYRYQITFEKDELPPVQSSWTITALDAQAGDTFTSFRHFKRNEDGSLTIYVQKESPGKAFETNWLKVSQGEFDLSLQLYWPKSDAVNMKWEPPAIEHMIKTNPLVMAN